MPGVVDYAMKASVAHVTITRPEAKNALNLATVQDLLAALKRASEDSLVRSVVVSGAGGDFSAGGDIKDMVERRGKGLATYERLKTHLAALVRTVTQLDKPVLARVDGVCLGAGAGLALSCDAIVATKRSTFGFPFVKVGLVPDTGSSWTLPHVAGIQTARRLLLTGDPVGAEEAQGLGIATEVVADSASLDAAVERWTQRWAALPPTALRDAKRLLWASAHTSLENALVFEAMAQGLRFTTDEHAKAVDAFLAKRREK